MTALTFIVPVRHHQSVSDWEDVKERMAETARSISSQIARDWQCVFVCNREASMPVLGAGIEVERVDLPYVPLPQAGDDPEPRYEAIRADKGRRVLAGLLATRPTGHVMVVDYDDFVSNRLAAFVAEHQSCNGWYLDCGYLYDGSPLMYRMPHGFDELCGSSLIINSRHYEIPSSLNGADEPYLRQWFGSHKFAKRALARKGWPLASLPFAGAIYRVGHLGATSASASIRKMYYARWRLRREPKNLIRDLSRARILTLGKRREFFGAQ